MSTPVPGHGGLRHLALRVTDLERSHAFYESLFGMRVVWQPDPDNVYLSSGSDNLALHRIPASEREQYSPVRGQFLDHFGVIMETVDDVDRMFEHAQRSGVGIRKRPKHHRDGSYSFYLADPDGNTIQVLYEPTISAMEFVRRKESEAKAR